LQEGDKQEGTDFIFPYHRTLIIAFSPIEINTVTVTDQMQEQIINPPNRSDKSYHKVTYKSGRRFKN
jgi:hypothetical protein